MNILMLVRNEYVSDIRIRREAEGLVDAGHHVHVVCRKRGSDKTQEELNGVTITRIGFDSQIGFMIDEGVYASTWYQPLWLWKLRKLMNRENYDIIYYHDVYYTKVAKLIADWYDIDIVADLHEMIEKSVKAWRKSDSFRDQFHPQTLLNPTWRYKKMEEFSVKNCDGLITVSEELLDYFIREYDYSGPYGIVRNVPDLNRLDEMTVADLEYENDFVISYIGGFTPQRNIEIAIKAMPSILQNVPEAKLVLVGDGRDNYVTQLHNLCETLGVMDNVEFVGWVDYERVRSYFESSAVTLVPLDQSSASDHALPNKLFQAMAFGVPILASDCSAMRQIITDAHSGLLFDNREDLVEKITHLYQNPGQRQRLGKNGREAVEQKYNIETELESLHKILSELNNVK